MPLVTREEMVRSEQEAWVCVIVDKLLTFSDFIDLCFQ